jgi:hypothetical protein
MQNDNLSMAIASLEEELEGVQKYKDMIEKATCQDLKKIFYDNMQTEKKHVSNLLAWINAETHKTLK